MKFTVFIASLCFLGAAVAAPSRRAFNPALIPPTQVTPGNPACQGDSIGPVNQVRIPCRCPPSDAQLRAIVQQEHPNIPQGLDLDSTLNRFQLTLASLQTLKCPAASTQIKGKLDKLGALKASGRNVPQAEVAAAIRPVEATFSPVLVGAAAPGFNGQRKQ
ncbi:hypothetical protein SpCBS45565_g04539 [Spizellomyces sp. 'palustris']|nr:hypothetical protein SpCBS45565_g04539 [Spizellomyces sp. 'palustris']